MIEAHKLVEYFRLACADILERGTVDATLKHELRPGQRQGYEALDNYLVRGDLTDDEKLVGLFKMTVGLGKTGFFGALADRVLQRTHDDGHRLRVVIVAPKIDLLEQTYKELTTFFPYLKNKVGIYGGHWPKDKKFGNKAGKPRREADKDVTVISVPSWEKLLDAGKLNSDTVHVHFADEGHRLTSELREKRLEELLAHAVRFAFTATADFSKEKTVLTTHKRMIFEKGLVASVRDGESAAYVRAQHHVIRVNPPKEGNEDDLGRMRQMAFINFVKGMLLTGADEATGERFGFDEVTGDRLTDNQIGIYVGDTAQADKCAAILNTDPELQKVASTHKAEAFAVSIHTRGINTEQQRNLKKAYEDGRRRALAGDELFKEGYNYAPMKVVIVMQTGSPLDLEQIMGRGARKWWNKEKRRYEGLTAISTTIYIGVDPLDPHDPVEIERARRADERARARALAESASAVDILEGNVEVVGPGAKRGPKPRPQGGGGITGIFGDIQVTSYTSVEAVKTIHAEMEEARKVFPEKEIGWVSANDMTAHYVGTSTTLSHLLEAYVYDKCQELTAQGHTSEIAANIVDKKFVGMRSSASQIILCASPAAIDDLKQKGQLRPRSALAHIKEINWMSASEMTAYYVGDSRKFNQLLGIYVNEKHQELIVQGNAPETAATIVDQQFVGIRSSNGKEALFASPDAISELIKKGHLRSKDTRAPAKGLGWLCANEMTARYVGNGKTLNTLLEDYAEIKRRELIEQGHTSENASILVDQKYVGIRSSSGNEALFASPEVIADLMQKERLRLRNDIATRERDWVSANDMTEYYVGNSKTLNVLLENYAKTKRQELIESGQSSEATTILVDQKYVGVRYAVAHKNKALFASPETIAELLRKERLHLRIKKAPEKESGWLSRNDMLKYYIGETKKFSKLLEAYANDKRQELIAQGNTPEAAAISVDKQFVGLRAAASRSETICVAPSVLLELEQQGKLCKRDFANDHVIKSAKPFARKSKSNHKSLDAH